MESGERGGWERVLQDLTALRDHVICAAAGAATTVAGGFPPLIASVVGDGSVLPEFEAATAELAAGIQGARTPPSPHAAQLEDFYLPCTPFPLSVEELSAFASVPGVSMGLSAGDVRALPQRTPTGQLPVDFSVLVPATVNFVVKGGRLSSAKPLPLPPTAHAYALPSPLRQAQSLPSSLEPPSALLRTGYLWEKVRVGGGAYGAGVSLNFTSGAMAYHSYRDPNIGDTLESFDGVGGALEALAGAGQCEALLEGPILSTIGGIDAPLAPVERGDKAAVRWIHGGSPEYAQQWRDGILGAGKKDVLAMAEAAEEVRVGGRVAVVGGEQALSNWERSAGGRGRVVLKPFLKK